ncbi:hypothetical protein [Nitrosomonas mobilis]|uniref:Uncharacterized protein n=1 Tax=Nitrosomonas mobilis TaxID=51642 RepID=A0A1G5SE27_9PROT|nr:hypothetical protein [Nitrosomonas mobilis]SCZ85368.1 hypothetical protein NSMM_370147 [Nitrosomonas mobilis]
MAEFDVEPASVVYARIEFEPRRLLVDEKTDFAPHFRRCELLTGGGQGCGCASNNSR